MADKDLAWSLDVINYLSIKYPIARHLKQQIFELNFGHNLSRIKTTFTIWSARHLTLLGKITIIKSLVIPTLTCKLSLLSIEIPKKFNQELNKTLFHFIWGSNWERISRLKLGRSLGDDGANMLNIDSYFLALRLKWVNSIFTHGNNTACKEVENLFFTNYDYVAALV